MLGPGNQILVDAIQQGLAVRAEALQFEQPLLSFVWFSELPQAVTQPVYEFLALRLRGDAPQGIYFGVSVSLLAGEAQRYVTVEASTVLRALLCQIVV